MKTGFASWMLIGVLASSAHAFDVTGCGQLVPAGQVGVLQADLDCSATSGNCFDDPARGCAQDPGCTDAQCPGVVVRKDATLQMNGHTVANGVVLCADSCAVVGPGTVVGGFGVASMKNLTVSGGLDVHDGAIGIAATRNAIVSDATVTGVAHNWAIWGNWNLRVANVTANGNGVGLLAGRSLTGSGVTANDNVHGGVAAHRVNLTGVTATGNGSDADAFGGVFSETGVHLRSSTVTGNSNVLDGVTRPLDVFSGQRPRLIDSTCSRSRVLSREYGPHYSAINLDWGVCTGD